MNVIILRGVPGSGKSTYVKRNPNAVVVSADHYFTDDKGLYNFDPTKLPLAHAKCLREFVDALLNHRDWEQDVEIVVDNTNTSVMEVAPYAALALAYGASLRVVTLKCDPVAAAARNVHGVPESTVLAMAKRLEDETPRLAPWWEHVVVEQ